ncbi:MAG: single-stranded-DNA-specific exonuclease RecJ, partial [Alphaproteobacteria bacterium]|nr:single-stranded-DNA-specific exonuclease RecJ [Alphaproteobacteria bacterium]
MSQTAISPAQQNNAAVLDVVNSFTGRIWRQRLADDRTAVALSQRLSIPDIVGRVLAGRGVNVEECEDFLNPTLRSVLPDPSCLR